MMKRICYLLAALLLCLCTVCNAESLDYSDPDMWIYYGIEDGYDADVFFIAPTNVLGDEELMNADITDDDQRYAIEWSVAMQTGIYGTQANFYSPYYRQITLACYAMDEEARDPYLALAEEDVLAAFDWYMTNLNDGRPVIIAGFSQGADMGLRILKAYAENEAFQNSFVAAYLIGWRVTDEDLEECPALRMAQGESDTGVIISFECEAEDVTDSMIVPAGTHTYSINPLNWKTDSTPAAKEENFGCAYPGKDGSIQQEIPAFCGAYIDADRGTLKVTDISAADYPAILAILPEGSYHIYDYQFFYRNLQTNVETRLNAWQQTNAK